MFQVQEATISPADYPLWYCIQSKNLKELNDYCIKMENYCAELMAENEILHKRLDKLSQEDTPHERRKYRLQTQKRKRRTVRELEMEFSCPYPRCEKQYASELALNLHIRNKHNGGSKTQRENLARLIALSEQKGEAMPQISINFPPGYLEKFKKDFFGRK